MKSPGIVSILLVVAMLSCKDNTQTTSPTNNTIVIDTVSNDNIEVASTPTLDDYYQPRLNTRGDTLLPYIPQDSVQAYFTRYAREHKQTKVRMSTRFGDIDIELFEETPLYRASFLFLIKHGYFDETVIHRVVEGFIIQAGDSDQIITAQKKASAGNYQLPMNILPNVKHSYGTLSSSKYWENNPENWHNPFDFFISLRATAHLDGEHTIFGRVISGMDVANAISKVPTDSRDWPLKDIFISMSIID